MAKKIFAALVAAVMSLFLTSCEKSSFVGLDYTAPQQESNFTPPQQVEEKSVSESVPEIEKDLPLEWGEIVGASISTVPAELSWELLRLFFQRKEFFRRWQIWLVLISVVSCYGCFFKGRSSSGDGRYS